MPRAFVFPGQGSHAAGMGEALAAAFPVAREMFEEIDEALKQNLTRLMFQGPEDELVLTENAQPALMAVSLATVRVLVQEGGIDLAGTVAFVAGHSLGEYSALAAAGALRLDEAARLLKARGRAMQEAVPVGEGAMAAVFVPTFARTLDEEGREGAWKLLGRTLSLLASTLITLIVAIEIVIAAIWYFSSGDGTQGVASRRLNPNVIEDPFTEDPTVPHTVEGHAAGKT